VLDRVADQVEHLRVVVGLRAPRHFGDLGHPASGRRRIAVVDQAADRRVQQLLARFRAPFLLRAPLQHRAQATCRLQRSK